eukprot:g2670.t1
MTHFHVVGDALVDLVASGLAALPEPDGDATAQKMALRAGGSALNTAVHLESLAPGRVSFYAAGRRMVNETGSFFDFRTW